MKNKKNLIAGGLTLLISVSYLQANGDQADLGPMGNSYVKAQGLLDGTQGAGNSVPAQSAVTKQTKTIKTPDKRTGGSQNKQCKVDGLGNEICKEVLEERREDAFGSSYERKECTWVNGKLLGCSSVKQYRATRLKFKTENESQGASLVHALATVAAVAGLVGGWMLTGMFAGSWFIKLLGALAVSSASYALVDGAAYLFGHRHKK